MNIVKIIRKVSGVELSAKEFFFFFFSFNPGPFLFLESEKITVCAENIWRFILKKMHLA